jgi:hypothetical protein
VTVEACDAGTRYCFYFLFFIFYSLIPVAVAKLDSERGLNPATQTAIPSRHICLPDADAECQKICRRGAIAFT